jgi:hypothetical protein
MTTALNILKLIGLVLTGAFGILGLLTEFRNDKTKKITKWGKVALSGIVLSTALSVVAQVLESAKSVRDARESEKQARDQISRSNEILNNLNRSLNPLANVRITYWLKVPIDAPELKAYRKRLTDGIAAFMASGHNDVGTAYVSESDSSGRAEEVAIPNGSPLMPRRDEEIPYYLLRFSGLDFSFFRQAHDASADFVADDFLRHPRSDLSFGVDTNEKSHYSLEYNLESKELTIYALDLYTDPQYWQSNNVIQAVPDLANTQMAVKIDDSMVPRLSSTIERDPEVQTLCRLRSQMELESLILKINTRELWVKRNKMRDVQRVSGGTVRPTTVYLTILPKDIDSLQLR